MIIIIFWKLNFNIDLSSERSRKAEPWQPSLARSSFSKPTHYTEGEQSSTELKWCACALDRQKAFSLIRCQTVLFESLAKTSSCLAYANEISGWIRICPCEYFTRSDLAWSLDSSSNAACFNLLIIFLTEAAFLWASYPVLNWRTVFAEARQGSPLHRFPACCWRRCPVLLTHVEGVACFDQEWKGGKSRSRVWDRPCREINLTGEHRLSLAFLLGELTSKLTSKKGEELNLHTKHT